MAKITLTDGTIIEGTAEELIELQQATGTAEYSEEKSTEALKDSPQAETKDVRVGDYVVFDGNHIDITAGKPYKVTVVDSSDDTFAIIDDAEDEQWFGGEIDEASYKLYRPIEGAPQVGDKILVVNAENSGGRYSNGKELTVSEVNSGAGGVYVKEVGLTYLYRREFVIIERAGEHIPQEPTTEIEEGDIVRVTGETAYDDIPKGTLATVREINDCFQRHEVFLIETYDDIDRTSSNNLELVAKKADRKDLSRKDLAK